MPLTLLQRITTGRPLTPAEHDQNLQAIIAAYNALESAIGVALNENGTLKDGAVNVPGILANNVVSLDKMATGSEANRGRYLRFNPVTDVLQAWPIEKPTAYMRNDDAVVEMDGIQSASVISSWDMTDLPAGGVTVIATLYARRNGSSATGGTINVSLGNVDLGGVNTHHLQNSFTLHQPVTIIGHLANFAGGNATLKITMETAEAGFDMTFGIEDDLRFGRRVLLTAGY